MVRVVGLKPTSLAVPNHAFYQLNYTRKYTIIIAEITGKGILLWSKLWQNRSVSALSNISRSLKALHCRGFHYFVKITKSFYNNVPKQAPYQLGYTRKCKIVVQYILLSSDGIVKQILLKNGSPVGAAAVF